jgi:hypothetical protein
MNPELPKLRSRLEAVPVQHSGSLHIVVRDLEGLNPHTVILSPHAYFLASLMDGSNSLVDIQAAFMRRFGTMLFREKVEALIRDLDSQLLLENDHSRSRREELISEFRNQPFRPPCHAGLSYETDPDQLRAQLLSFFAPENGGPGNPEPAASERQLLGLVAPHIDLRAGGPCFAHAYKALVEAGPIHTCVILGTGHEPLPHYFALTRKEFQTPLGMVAVNNDFIDRLISRCPLDLLADEFYHRREHTIEFQTLFLKLLTPNTRIVPLLCSFGVEEIQQRPQELLELARSLHEILDTYPEPVCLLASVDLAHIGPRYGDPFKPHPGTIHETREADHHLLQTVLAADGEAFAGLLVREQNRRRICGLPPLYVMLNILAGRSTGELLRYDYTEVDADHSFVTFASVALYENTT